MKWMAHPQLGKLHNNHGNMSRVQVSPSKVSVVLDNLTYILASI